MQLRIILSPTANATKNHSHLGGKAEPGYHVASGLCLGGLTEGFGRIFPFRFGNIRLPFRDPAKGQGFAIGVKHRLNIRIFREAFDGHVRLACANVDPVAGNDVTSGLQGVPDSEGIQGDRDDDINVLGHGPKLQKVAA